jgi:hypothetical protein
MGLALILILSLIIPCLVMGLALTHNLMMGLALSPFMLNIVSCLLIKNIIYIFISQNHRGDLCCATYESHVVDGVLSKTAVLVAGHLGGACHHIISRFFDDFALPVEL